MSSSTEQKSTSNQRNLWLLVGAQALGGATPPIIISTAGLVGQDLIGSNLATLPVSLYNLGLALSVIPAAMLMRFMGRRPTYSFAALIAVVSGILATYAILKPQPSFVLFCIAMGVAGFYAACVQNYRFAAADSVDAEQRPKAISRIMLGGLAAAIIGPQVAIYGGRIWADTSPYAGSFLGLSFLALLALPLLLMLQLPSRQFEKDPDGGTGRSLTEIAAQPAFIVAAVAGVVSYGLMAFMMTAAPMAMVGQGFTPDQAKLAIQWHVLAMFGPSFITGSLIARFGKITITSAGLLILALSAVVALMGLELWHFNLSLILLGVGWNFGFIGATALVADTYSQVERSKAQAMNDFAIFGTVAIASFGSGYLLHNLGWEKLNFFMLPIIAVVLVMLAWLRLQQKKETVATA